MGKLKDDFDMNNDKHFLSVLNEILSSDDRTTAIVGGAMVENALEFALKAALPNKKDFKDLFSFNGPLGTFANKIHFAFALGIIGPVAQAEITRLKDIRNTFAHNMLAVDGNKPARISFERQSIADTCKDFRLVKFETIPKPDGTPHKPRERYALVCTIVVMKITQEVKKRTKANTMLIRTSPLMA